VTGRDRYRTGSPFEQRFGFSRAIRVGDRIEVAGTAPIPFDGSPPPVSAHDQMLLCGGISVRALEHLGGTVSDVVRVRMFVVDAIDADDVGSAFNEVFGSAAPVATMVVVAGLLDPRWRVEIEVTAVVHAG
jgi:enamine deaminase RidA (YjgF/YER057c/UK114 family)